MIRDKDKRREFARREAALDREVRAVQSKVYDMSLPEWSAKIEDVRSRRKMLDFEIACAHEVDDARSAGHG